MSTQENLYSTRETRDLTHASIHRIPGETPEEQHRWKTAYKSEYSNPRRRWSHEELLIRFPDGEWTKEGFVADNGEMQRVFNTKGYEVQRRHYRKTHSRPPTAFDEYIRDISEYDDDGYLIRYTYLERGKIGYIATLEYQKRRDGTKELVREVNQDILRNGLVMESGRPIGKPFIIDLSDISLMR